MLEWMGLSIYVCTSDLDSTTQITGEITSSRNDNEHGQIENVMIKLLIFTEFYVVLTPIYV